jgi:hypothetical protein
MTCTIPNAPPAPSVLHFQAWESKANASLGPFGGPGVHSNTKVTFGQLKPFSTIVDTTLGFAAVNFTLGGLALTAGETYWLRAQFTNEVGDSAKSLNAYSIVPSDLSFPSITIPTEPVPATALTIPINPSYVAQPTESRDVVEWKTQTGDIIRRLVRGRGRFTSVMGWDNLNTADRDTVRNFLEARADAVEAFASSDEPHGTRTWFVRRGTITTRQMAPAVWSLQIDADEVFVKRFWTVGVSLVGGPDTIR